MSAGELAASPLPGTAGEEKAADLPSALAVPDTVLQSTNRSGLSNDSPAVVADNGSIQQKSLQLHRDGAAAAAVAAGAGSHVYGTEGMRREWNFMLLFIHEAARLLLQCSPQWQYRFIDPDLTALGLAQRDQPDTARILLLPVLSYTDRSAVLQQPSTTAATSVAGASGVLPGSEAAEAADADDLETAVNAEDGTATDEDTWWVEKMKHVDVLYCHLPPNVSLYQFCVHCVQHTLQDVHVVSVDGETNLNHLHVGQKLDCPHRLGGVHRCFHFSYTIHNRTELLEVSVYAIGTVVNQRGYLFLVSCTSVEELQGYLTTTFLPLFTDPSRLRLNEEVSYHTVPTMTAILSEQQEAFGEMQYIDSSAAIVFVTPMFPMRLRPDYSPAKTVGVGSIACMTLELNVHERLLDDLAAAEIVGMAKFKVNNVTACVDVEDVARMGYPSVMSTEQYSAMKVSRIVDLFSDAKVIGLPTTVYMGGRVGRCRTLTFTYEPFHCTVKALCASTLVGNYGVTALYLTKLSGGLFDSHLYIFQQVLSGLEFLPQNIASQNLRVSRFDAPNVQLMDDDIARAYQVGPVMSMTAADGDSPEANALQLPLVETCVDPRVVATAKARHLEFYKLGNNGCVEGGRVAAVAPDDGGFVSHGAAATAHIGGDIQSNTGDVAPILSVRQSVSGLQEGGLNDRLPPRSHALFPMEEPPAVVADMDLSSFHRSSVIDVSAISHLAANEYDSDGSNDAAAMVAAGEMEAALGSSVNSSRVVPPAALEGGSVNSAQRPSFSAESGQNLNHLKSEEENQLNIEVENSVPLSAAGSSQHVSSIQQGGEKSGDIDDDVSQAPYLFSTSERPSEARICLQPKDLLAFEEVQLALHAGETGAICGPSLRDVYARCCEVQRCRPNSYLMKKLPAQPEFTYVVEEIDLSSNYVGHNGFVAVLHLMEHLPRLRAVYFNNMSLDNIDVENLCELLKPNQTVREVHLRNNTGISLPAMRYLTTLLNVNRFIWVLALDGTRLSSGLIQKLQDEAGNRRKVEEVHESAAEI